MGPTRSAASGGSRSRRAARLVAMQLVCVETGMVATEEPGAGGCGRGSRRRRVAVADGHYSSLGCPPQGASTMARISAAFCAVLAAVAFTGCFPVAWTKPDFNESAWQNDRAQ